jgi:Holliday junction resolvase
VTERELKAVVLLLAKKHGWHVFHLPATTIRGSQGRGYPDLTLARGGVVHWFELKQEKGTVTAEQFRWGAALSDWRVIRPSDIGEVEELLR